MMRRVLSVLAVFMFMLCLSACSGAKKDYISRHEAYMAMAGSIKSRTAILEEYSEADSDYKAYAEFLKENSYISEYGEENEYLSGGELKEWYEMLPEEGKTDKIKSSGKVSRKRFYEFYRLWCRHMDKEGNIKFEEETFYSVLDKNKNSPPDAQTEDTIWISASRERYEYRGKTDFNSYLDKSLNIIYSEDRIFYIEGIAADKAFYQNVLIERIDEDSALIMISSTEREFNLDKKFAEENKQIFTEANEGIADISISGGIIDGISLIRKKINAKVLSQESSSIELEGYGILEVSDKFSSYVSGDWARESLGQIRPGSAVHDFYIRDNIVEAAIRTGDYSLGRVRVLIRNNSFKPEHHYSISLKSDSGMRVRLGDEIREIGAGESFVISAADWNLPEAERIFAESMGESGIEISSIKRASGIPVYSGGLEIIRRNSVLYLINEVDTEEYLRRVVASEMPHDYEIEALKAQAVTARTYVYKAIETSGDLRKFGAHVDDSINYQVYNNSGTSEKTDIAVKETERVAVRYKGRLADTFYYSTSAGVSTDASIWGRPAEEHPYLNSHAISPDRENLNLTTNDAFKSFLMDKEYPAYERNYSFYRWQTVTTNRILNEKLTKVGNVLNIAITKRGEGGIAKELRVDGEGGSYTISGQNAIRAALGSEHLEITRYDGKKIKGWSSLPSSFIAVEASEPDESNTVSFTIYGGGYGHGVGMSQNAANEMAAGGMSYTDILNFFYDGIDIG